EPGVGGQVELCGVIARADQVRVVAPGPWRRDRMGDHHQMPAPADRRGGPPQDRDPVELDARLEERGRHQLDRLWLGLPGAEVGGGESGALEAAEIGRASCRERMKVKVVAESVTRKA